MSYNSYPNSTSNYSSYLQQPVNGRSQYPDQPRDAYSSDSYQPLSAYQTSQRPQPYTPSSNSSSNANNYQNYGSGASDGMSQDTRAGFNDGRSSVDTTALGNLAYASSLPRDGTTPTQATPYHSNQHNSGYRYPSTYGVSSAPSYQYNADRGRTGGQPAVTSRADNRAQGATASPSFGYSANRGNAQAQAQAQTQGPNNNTASQTRQAYPAAQQYQTSQFNKPPSRPSSVQAIHQAHSRNASQGPGLQSPSSLVNTVISSSEKSQQNKNSPIGNARVSTPRQQTSQQSTRQPPTIQSTNPRQAQSHASPKTSSNMQSVPARDGTQAAVGNNSSSSQSAKASTPTINQSFATVDPSQVFNNVEYQRRQAAAEAEAIRKKAEDNQNAPQPASNQPSRVPSVAPSNSDADSEKKNQMELEMKTMIEKMRDYKSKDPSLFSQIWEQVKKGQPTPRASTQSQSQSAPQAAAVSPVVIDGQSPSAGPQAQLPPESELPAAEPFPIGFDRGRFPAQRRRRGGANYTPPKKPATPKGPNTTATPVDPLESSKPPVVPPVAQMVEQRPAATYSTVLNQPSTSPVAGLLKPQTPKETGQTGQPPKAGGTYWPENKKRQLAEAAKNELTSQPRNAGKYISTDDLHALLDQNPSYTQMCEILEYRGFAIDRGQFARQLLAAVPDLGSTSSKVASAKPPAPETSTAPSSSLPPPAARPWPHSVRRDIPGNGYVKPYTSSDPPGQTPGRNMNKIQGQQQYVQPYHTTNVPSSGPRRGPNSPAQLKNLGALVGPPTKQDLARKRSFGEIVDLTQGTSDEDEPPSQRLRTEGDPPQRTERPSIQAPDQASTDIGKDGTHLDDFRFNPTDTAAGKYIHSLDICQPMNKRQDALRRSSYNPKTIAGDILVALGKHPTMAPLNDHLERLRETFVAINYDSDLNTIRWDLIDPGGPPPPTRKARSSEKDIKTRPIVAVMVGDEVPKVKRQGSGLKPTRGGHSTTLARRKESSTQPSTHFDLHRYVNNELPAMLEPITGTSIGSSRPYKTAPNNSSSTPAPNSVDSSSPFTPSGPRRIGRPPGAKNKNPRPDRGKPKGSKNIPTPAQKKTTPPYEEDAPLDNADKAQPLINSTPNRPRVQTTPAKPSGLRNAMSPTDGIAVVIPSRSPSIALPSRASSEISSKNRRLSIVNGVNDKQSPEYSHTVYRCRWERCPAKLHDLETLKKHIRMKHRRLTSREGNSLLCLWKDCYVSEYTESQRLEADAIVEDDRLSFEHEKAWDRHVQGVHVDAMAKELGGDPSAVSLAKRRTSHSLHTTPGKSGKLSGLGWSPASAKPMVVL